MEGRSIDQSLEIGFAVRKEEYGSRLACVHSAGGGSRSRFQAKTTKLAVSTQPIAR